MEVGAIEGLRLANLYSSLEGGFVNPSKEGVDMCAVINTYIAIEFCICWKNFCDKKCKCCYS